MSLLAVLGDFLVLKFTGQRYHMIGNVGFMGYSGAHSYEETLPYIEEACSWASSQSDLDVLVLLGHWNSPGDGCEADMTVSAMFENMKGIQACAPVAARMKYFVGHKHCNMVVEDEYGFMVRTLKCFPLCLFIYMFVCGQIGGQGMSDAQCGGDFGIPVLDTTGKMSSSVLYLQLCTVLYWFALYVLMDDCLSQEADSSSTFSPSRRIEDTPTIKILCSVSNRMGSVDATIWPHYGLMYHFKAHLCMGHVRRHISLSS